MLIRPIKENDQKLRHRDTFLSKPMARNQGSPFLARQLTFIEKRYISFFDKRRAMCRIAFLSSQTD